MNNLVFRFHALCCCLLFLSSCKKDNFTAYNRGYEAGWNESGLSDIVDIEEKMGYEDGLMDSVLYNDGYCDGSESKKPQYPHDALYMEGYNDGKKYSI